MDGETSEAGGAGTSPVVLVEGESDAVLVRYVLASRGAVADVLPMGGVTNLPRCLERHGGPSRRVLTLLDADEQRVAVRALRRFGRDAETADELARHGVFVCERDLEDLLIRALGPDRVLDGLAAMGELGAFASFSRMPQWRRRHVVDRLHRFAGSGSGRKARLAAALAPRLDPDDLPDPLDALVLAVLAAGP
ncbi:ATP-dependent endonuclease [Phycicoccus flavus]|uniref:ATP-dependent endonuclease n=1 Tax=Phycicoccus flavus TaxID=2502783 RepID=A0A8T6R0J2_9MICO|nr:ATP-dependent endonuclease [Phycicoccus flavus]NHA67153.1 ATP-dependent endonuclease [Phycicoccus flavus]